ncbi:GMC family oxidoreductase N-terminal domain-containing protein [Mesorhizobium sp. M0323]|uniref:GMC family oxidoreductase n=1 Tax=Mesorhizobium sp. M0323 TaxID=2956938 RepID=UPI00333C7502
MPGARWDLETDYCIVGAGSAGCVLAARLSEDKSSKVLLLEAGSRDWHPFIHIPAGYFYLLRSTRHNWMYRTEPEPNTFDRDIIFPAGRGVGGTSSINGILFTRGQAAEYDRFANELGCKGWDYQSLLPYFKKAETFEGEGSEFRGTSGPINVAPFRTLHPLTQAFVQASGQVGYPRVKDMNAPVRDGVSLFQQNRNGRFRASAASAYLWPALRTNSNLAMETNAVCTRIVLSGSKVEGLEFQRSGKLTRVRVRREVIVSCGALRSPQLLQLSGIGDPSHLAKIGVVTNVKSPYVGKNLRDKYMVRVSHRTKGLKTINESNTLVGLSLEVLKYVFANKGLITLGASMAAIYLRSSPEVGFPDLQLQFAPVSFSAAAPGRLESAGGMTIGVWLSYPQSSGSVLARSSNPFDAPAINPNYLAVESDWSRMLAGVRAAREVFAARALSQWSVGEIAPGRDAVTHDDLYDYARGFGTTSGHYAGTCHMGSTDVSVTDTELRVRGVSRLRVVDNSVVPGPVSGGMNATAIAVAERAADLIRKY